METEAGNQVCLYLGIIMTRFKKLSIGGWMATNGNRFPNESYMICGYGDTKAEAVKDLQRLEKLSKKG